MGNRTNFLSHIQLPTVLTLTIRTLSGIQACPFLCMPHPYGNIQELVGPQMVAKSHPANFLSSTSVGLLAASFARSRKSSFCLERFLLLLVKLQSLLAAIVETKKGLLEAWQPAPTKKNRSWLPQRVSFFHRAPGS